MAEPLVIVLLGADYERLDVEPGEELRVDPDQVHRFICVSSMSGITVWNPTCADSTGALAAGTILQRWTGDEPGERFAYEPEGEPGGLNAALLTEAAAPQH